MVLHTQTRYSSLQRASTYAPILVRIGMSAVFLWFGINQVLDPANYLGYLPDVLFSLSYAQTIVIINGVFEIVLGSLLLIGLFTRIAALLLGVHLLIITIELGYGELGVRDFGLTMATLSTALYGPDKWCADHYLRKKKQTTKS